MHLKQNNILHMSAFNLRSSTSTGLADTTNNIPSIFKKKDHSNLPSPQNTLSTCSSWTSSVSPTSLALRSLPLWPSFSRTFSTDSNDDDVGAVKVTTDQFNNVTQNITTERKKWIEDTFINTTKSSQSYTTAAREEMCKDQYNNEVVNNRKRWVKDTLLSNKVQAYYTNAREEMCKDQYSNEVTSERKQWIESTLLSTPDKRGKSLEVKDLPELQQLPPSSVSKRREWLANVSQVQSTAELEKEVRLEREEVARKKAEEKEAAARMIKEEKEEEERINKIFLESLEKIKKVAEEKEAKKKAEAVEQEIEKEVTAAIDFMVSAVEMNQITSSPPTTEEEDSTLLKEEETKSDELIEKAKQEQPMKDSTTAAEVKPSSQQMKRTRSSSKEGISEEGPKQKRKKSKILSRFVKQITSKKIMRKRMKK